MWALVSQTAAIEESEVLEVAEHGEELVEEGVESGEVANRYFVAVVEPLPSLLEQRSMLDELYELEFGHYWWGEH